jgi:hypothetical protein
VRSDYLSLWIFLQRRARVCAVTLLRHFLHHHPSTPCAVVDEVVAEIGVESPGVLAVCWRVVGEIGALRVPERRLGPERLWEHTCLELFVAPGPGEAYVEWNFSPTGQVATFAFSSYRVRASVEESQDAAVRVAVASAELRVDGRVRLPDGCGDATRLGLTAVLEDAAGGLSYFAVHHPCEKPDFHHRGGFVVALGFAGGLLWPA